MATVDSSSRRLPDVEAPVAEEAQQLGMVESTAAAATTSQPGPEAVQPGQSVHFAVEDVAVVTPSDPEARLPSSTTIGQATTRVDRIRTSLRSTITGRSRWRWPSEPGKLPHYVRQQFLFKSFGLIATQCLVAFCVAALVELFLRSQMQDARKGGFSFALFISMGCVSMLVLLTLLCVQRLYPVNYIVLAALTVLVGITWGMGGTALAMHAHFQLFGILCVATSFTAAFSTVSHRFGGKTSVAAPLLAGWALGSAIEAIMAWQLGAHPIWSGLAVIIALGQIIWLLLDVGDKLRECNPDDFMRIVISMDSTLLVVVSIPLFVVAACFLHANTQAEQEEQEGAAAAANRAAAAA